jgi:hypothetical protein
MEPTPTSRLERLRLDFAGKSSPHLIYQSVQPEVSILTPHQKVYSLTVLPYYPAKILYSEARHPTSFVQSSSTRSPV